MTTARKFFVMSILAAAAVPLFAYNDTVTHPQLTIFAAHKSVLYTDRSILISLGLLPATNQLGQTVQTYSYRGRVGGVTSGTATYPIAELIGEGAFDEDAGKRALNHFFDPVFDRPLTILGVKLGERSWRWTLEDAGPIDGQDFSVADARAYLTKGLTYNDGTPANSDQVRGSSLGLLFLSLGHMVHHIQDMAQPQHVRNDDHLDSYSLFGLNPFFNPSRYEAYTKDRTAQIAPFANAATPVYPGSNDFVVARDFWFNGANSGIAQRDNRDFVSHKTNFTMFLGQVNVGTYALPVPGPTTDYTPDQLFALSGTAVPTDIKNLCGDPAINCTMTMYATTATPRASTLSIFDQDLKDKGVYVTYNDGDLTPTYYTERLFALNQFNHDAAHSVLIGRAVSYSAGIINHFFRGRLEVTPPSNGPYAVVDQSFGTGFTTIKCRVKNATLNEALSQGTLQAIAHFHRNGCYKADLSGEFRVDPNTGQLITPCPNYRSFESYIRLTAEQPIAFDIGETKDMTFTFADPIPLDATDLTLEVYFRGTVGGEAQTFALGVADLSEPTFIAIMNATDVFELSGTAFYYPDDIINGIANPPFSVVDINGDQVYSVPPDVDVRGGDMSFDLYLNNELVGSIPMLPQGRFSRLAAILDPNSAYVLTDVARGAGFFFEVDDWVFSPKVNQVDPDQGAYIVAVVDYLRNQTLQFDSIGYFRFYPFPGADIDLMPPSKADNATAPVGIDMTAQNVTTALPLSRMLPAPAAAQPPVSVAPAQSQDQPPVMQGANKPVKKGKGKKGG